MFQNDYILRQVEMLSQFIASVVLKKNTVTYPVSLDENGRYTDAAQLYLTLIDMIKKGQINEAEDKLFDRIELDLDTEYLEISIDFYSQLSQMSEEFLEAHDFSKEEVLEGLTKVKELYGIDM
ncbi:MAG: DUF6483 family protein [Bacillota bacterium]|nr:DUF6483 family protein [Bacillota bacterium]